MFGQARYGEINRLLNAAFDEKQVLIAMHRGAWGGNVPENTVLSFRLALDMGADLFECDLSMSTDGVVYAFHDGGERRMLGIDRNIKTLPSEEIDRLVHRNSIGEPSGVPVARFEEIVAAFRDGELYNIDRAWDLLPQATAVLKKYPGSIQQAIFKTPVTDEALGFFCQCPDKYMFMPIVYTMEEVRRVLSYPDINLVGMELIATSPECELFQDENIRWIKEKNLFVWANAINLSGSSRHALFGGLDDDTALVNGRDAAWGKMMEKQVDIIQTDWPYQIKAYRNRRLGV